MYKFDHNWFAQNVHNLQNLFYDKREAEISILEIGAFEGMSTAWFLDNLPNSKVTTIDTWDGGVDHDSSEIDFKKAKENFEHNMSFHQGRVEAIQGNSFDVLIELYRQCRKYDFIYIDGSHTAADVNSDLILSFRMLNVGGAFYCDDYLWGFNEQNVGKIVRSGRQENFIFDTPKVGVDAFVSVYGNKLRPIAIQCVAASFIKVAE